MSQLAVEVVVICSVGTSTSWVVNLLRSSIVVVVIDVVVVVVVVVVVDVVVIGRIVTV